MQNTLDTEGCRGNGKVTSCLTFPREGVLPQDLSHSSTFVSFFILCVGRERRCACECRCLQRPRCRSPPGAGLPGSYRPPEVGARKRTQIHSSPPSAICPAVCPAICPAPSFSQPGRLFLHGQPSFLVCVPSYSLLIK